MLRESKVSMEEIAAQILSIKKNKKPKSELRELVTQMFLNFVNLRQANRLILLEEDRAKAQTERAKAPVDFTTPQLHNLMYEKSHYGKAIKASIELAEEQRLAAEASRGNWSSAAEDKYKEQLGEVLPELLHLPCEAKAWQGRLDAQARGHVAALEAADIARIRAESKLPNLLEEIRQLREQVVVERDLQSTRLSQCRTMFLREMRSQFGAEFSAERERYFVNLPPPPTDYDEEPYAGEFQAADEDEVLEVGLNENVEEEVTLDNSVEANVEPGTQGGAGAH